MTTERRELAAVIDRFRARLAEAIANPPTELSTSQRAQLGRQARAIETTLSALDWQLARSWQPIQQSFAAALVPPAPAALAVDRAATRRKTRNRNRRNR